MPSSIKNIFNENAETYDQDPCTNFLFAVEHKKVLKLLDIKPEEKVLDIGCGTGKYITIIQEQGPTHIIGIDISEEMIQQSLDKNTCKNITYQVVDIEQGLPFSENTFDKINCAHVFKFITTQTGLNNIFKEISRVLKPGGIFVFSNNHPARDIDWSEFVLIQQEPENIIVEDEEPIMKLHQITDYQQAVAQAGITILQTQNIMIDETVKNLMEPDSYEKLVGKKIVIIMLN